MMDGGEITPRDLAELLNEPLGVVSYHVRMLRDYGLVECTRTEPRRGALAHYYTATGLADELIGCLYPMLGLPNMGRAGAERRREQLARWASGPVAVAA